MRAATATIATVALMLVAACAPSSVVRFPIATGDPVVAVSDADVVGPIHFDGTQLKDATGRVVLIHGTNSVQKGAPFISPLTNGWLGPDDLAQFRADGWNGVRLGVWAAALMPSPGVIDTAYLDQVEQVVNTLTANKLWVLLDFHQDVFSGMPTWATTPAAAAMSSEPPAFLSGIGWAAAYTSQRSLRQWEDWWTNAPVGGEGPDGYGAGSRGVIDTFGDGVAAVAERFRDASNVIGIDLLNEPFAGEQFLDCTFASCPGRYGQVTSAFETLTARVRAVAPTMGVWWEPFTYGSPFPGSTSPGPDIGYTFHAYCFDTDGGKPEAPDPASVTLCDGLFGEIFRGADDVRGRWQAPAILGEFGASSSPLNATGGANLADVHLVSWLHWHHPGAAPEVVRTQLVRTYAQATAGTPTLQKFDPATGDFEFRFTPDHSVTAPTSIVVPAEQYPDGYTATVVGGSVTSAVNAGRLTVIADPGATEVVVRVRR